MITKEMREVSTEINMFFLKLPSEILNKIPQHIKDYFKNNSLEEYDFVYDDTKRLIEQEFKEKTKGIIAYIYKEYICDDEQRQEYIKEYNKFLDKVELEKISFTPNEIFNKNRAETRIDKTLVTLKEKDKWYTQFVKWIENLFTKDNSK